MTEQGSTLGGGDPSGSDTFARYRYQSKLTLIHWLGTLTSNGPNAVFAEHVEDILLEYRANLVFIQVKTRAPSAGYWTADALCSHGGGIDSLCRAYAVAKDRNCTFALHLEGSVSPSNLTSEFVRDCSKARLIQRTKIMALLEGALGSAVSDELDDFLARLRIVPNQPAQTDIDSRCFRLLARLTPRSEVHAVEELYRQLLQIVEDAQQALLPGLMADATGVDFLEAHLKQLNGDSLHLVDESKRLTRERLQELIPAEHSAVSLLLIERSLEDRPLTALEEKLVAAGARDSVVATARQLRAMSEIRRFELMSGPISQIDQLSDVSNRTLVHARAIAELCRLEGEPANDVWAKLVAEPGLEFVDQAGLFNSDRLSLLGLLCCLSDECKFGWVAS